MIYVLQQSSSMYSSKQMRLVRIRDGISTHPPCTNHAVHFSLAENRVTAAAEALVTIAGTATVTAAGVGASALGTGSNMLLLTAWDFYLSLSLWLSSLVCHLRPVLYSPERRLVEICEAFPSMGNGELNHAQIEIMPHARILTKRAKKALSAETAGTRPTPIPAGPVESSKVRHLQEKVRREVDLSSSYLEDNSKPGLNRSLRLLSC